MNVKNVIGITLLFGGLLVAIIGFSKSSSPQINTKINGKEVVLKNSDSENLNWRAILGGAFASLGLGLLIFPNQSIIDAGKFD